jgi:hypothetical protein
VFCSRHCSVAVVVGDGPPKILLVVDDRGSLLPGELGRKSMMEGWGWQVTLLEDSDSQANYDAALALANVAYVSHFVTSGDVNTKLRNSPIKVVSEEGNIAAAMGFSSNHGEVDHA